MELWKTIWVCPHLTSYPDICLECKEETPSTPKDSKKWDGKLNFQAKEKETKQCQ